MSPLDPLLEVLDDALRTLFAPPVPARPVPQPEQPATDVWLTESECAQAARLMRVNRAGEIAAQALYSGQALTAREDRTRDLLQSAANEERDHLAWCQARLDALGGRASVLDPLWYGGAFVMGAASGLLGDRWSLGFLAETESQVEAHLLDHLDRMPAADLESRAVLEAMRQDEIRHGQAGKDAGGAPLPQPLPLLMRLASRVMTRTAAYV
jgi:ubiquinone biosynthesis monooxygenase Coq7